MLIGTNLRKSFGGVMAVRCDRIVIEPGKISALIGPSGSGKTSLLRALALVDPPTEGTVEVDGVGYEFPVPAGRISNPPWPRVSAVFQQLFLWPHLTLRQNITLPYRLRHKANPGRLLAEFVELFEMKEFLDRYPNETSGGQRQRAALARAMVLQPTYLLLDEITSALDVEQIGAILRCLTMLRQRGLGMLLITHLIGFAQRAADQVIFMDQGELLEVGGPAVLKNPTNERIRRFVAKIADAT